MHEQRATSACGHDRRRFLQGAAGVAAGLGMTASATATAHASGRRGPIRRIDVHAHYVPDDYRQALIDNGQSQPDGFPVLPTWSPEAHLATMDQVGVGTAMLSITSPGVTLGADPVEWARRPRLGHA